MLLDGGSWCSFDLERCINQSRLGISFSCGVTPFVAYWSCLSRSLALLTDRGRLHVTTPKFDRVELTKFTAQTIIVFAAYLAAGKLGQVTANLRSGNVGPVWPAYGVALGAFILFGSRVWFAIAAAAFLVAWSSPVPALTAAGQAAGTTLAAFVGSYLLRRVANFQPSLSRLRDALSMILLGAMGSALVSATIGVVVLYISHLQAYTGLGSTWLIYWLGDSTGVLLITPLLLMDRNSLRTQEWRRAGEFAALFLLLTVTCLIIFRGSAFISVQLNVLAFAVLPLVMWAAIRFGTSGSVLSVFLVATIATVSTGVGSGPFTQESPLINAVLLDIYFAVLSVSGLTLSAVIAEREQLVRTQAETEARLRLAGIVETSLREGEARFRLVADTAPVLIWMSGTDKLCSYFNKPWLEFTGQTLESQLGNGWVEGVHPDDVARCFTTYTHSFDTREDFRMEYRLRRHDGAYRWILDIGVPRFNPDSSFAGYIGSCIDITDIKMAADAMSTVNRKLIEAQEKERTKIARELHDDIGQRLSLLSIELDQLGGELSGLPEIHRRLDELRMNCNELATDTQALSHHMHSSSLDHLGMVPAMKGFCTDFAHHHKVEIEFHAEELKCEVPSDIALGLFRVLQESVNNAAKHSGASRFAVRVWQTEDQIHLTVADSGSGFDTDTARYREGLGLISMRERLKLIDGNLGIKSEPRQGTTIHAQVRLASGSESLRIAG
jgi:PAS domain S-box-containing protein